MRLLKLEFRGIFTGDHALAGFDERRETVQQSCLARTRTAGDQDIATRVADNAQHFSARLADRTEVHKVLQLQLVLFELTNGQRGAIDGQWRRDNVHTRTVQKARITDR